MSGEKNSMANKPTRKELRQKAKELEKEVVAASQSGFLAL
jgi:hypothetical protein